nr:PREDICTED: THO complex subunit 6 [Bemisia tabaci]
MGKETMCDETFYNTSLAQAISPCGNFLFVGNTYGQIFVFNLRKNCISLSGEMCIQPTHKVSCSKRICALFSSPLFLIVGSVGEIYGWHWNDLKLPQTETPSVAWTIQIPISGDVLHRADVNSVMLLKEDATENGNFSTLLAGCGDNKLYMFNLEDGKLVRTFEGHLSYIHGISILGSSVASASEDGSVRLWDIRQSSVTACVEPFRNDSIARPSIGKWIGDVDLSEQWMVCGGGPRLALWHVRTLSVGTIFKSVKDEGIHVSKFLEDKVLAAGASSSVFFLSYKDKIQAEIETSQITVYSVAYQLDPTKVMSIAGSSSKVDLCTNFYYRDHVLSLI